MSNINIAQMHTNVESASTNSTPSQQTALLNPNNVNIDLVSGYLDLLNLMQYQQIPFQPQLSQFQMQHQHQQIPFQYQYELHLPQQTQQTQQTQQLQSNINNVETNNQKTSKPLAIKQEEEEEECTPNLFRIPSDDSSVGSLTPRTLSSLLNAKEYTPSPTAEYTLKNKKKDETMDKTEKEDDNESSLRVDAPAFKPNFGFPKSFQPMNILKLKTIPEFNDDEGDDEDFEME